MSAISKLWLPKQFPCTASENIFYENIFYEMSINALLSSHSERIRENAFYDRICSLTRENAFYSKRRQSVAVTKGVFYDRICSLTRENAFYSKSIQSAVTK